MPAVSLVMTVSENHVIGDKNKLPWYLPADLRRFKELTTAKKIVMGRKTHESIGRALPNRENIIISRNPDYAAGGCKVVNSLQQAFDLASEHEELFVIGGSEIFKIAEPLATKIYLTKIQSEIEGDIFFKIDPLKWRVVSRQNFLSDADNRYAYSFLTLKSGLI